MSCGIGHRHSSDPQLLWLWCRPAAAAPIGPLVWEFPYAVGVALKSQKEKKRKEKKERKERKEGRKEGNRNRLIIAPKVISQMSKVQTFSSFVVHHTFSDTITHTTYIFWVIKF